MKYLVMLAAVLIISSCNFSGGGSVHIPPVMQLSTNAIQIRIEYSLTGSGSNDLASRRYKNVALTVNGKDRYLMNNIKDRPGKGTWSCMIPANAYNSGDTLNYTITCEFDGVVNSRSDKLILK